ncbi:hypothetical protein Nepgr_033623 [Nepenthes gracilis]|uniref:Uncharacterized protein n=1 Tax=Nepenthes gracilis TaxID=150966 RepID=A0AAD3TM63_NEPGR|nr:hypothetical protein Nepgr_033623 [Nepenthes gracilis]
MCSRMIPPILLLLSLEWSGKGSISIVLGSAGSWVLVALHAAILMALGDGYDAAASAFAAGNLGVVQCLLKWAVDFVSYNG